MSTENGNWWVALRNVTVSNVVIKQGEKPSQYYTTVLYPELVEDSLAVNPVEAGNINVWDYPRDDTMMITVPRLLSGTISSTIAFLTYTATTEEMNITVPTPQSGTLETTIAYPVYTGTEELVNLSVPTVNSGTLVVTINYVNYDNGVTEVMTHRVPTIIGVTLT